MIEYSYEFEGHELSKEVVMVMVRDKGIINWAGPFQLGLIIKNNAKTRYYAHGHYWDEAKLAPKDEYIPWTLETAEPVMLRDKKLGFKVWMNYSVGSAWYICDRGVFYYTYNNILEEFEQLDGTPAGTKI